MTKIFFFPWGCKMLLWLLWHTAASALRTIVPGTPHETLDLVESKGFDLLVKSAQLNEAFVNWATSSQSYLVGPFFCSKDPACLRKLSDSISVHPRLVSLWSERCMALALKWPEQGIPLLSKIGEHRAPLDFDAVQWPQVNIPAKTFFVQLLSTLSTSWGAIPGQYKLICLVEKMHPGGLHALLDLKEKVIQWQEMICQPEVLFRLLATGFGAAKLLLPLLIVPTKLAWPARRRRLERYSLETMLVRWLRVEWLLWFCLEHYDERKLSLVYLLAAWLRHVPKLQAFAALAPLWELGMPPKLWAFVRQSNKPWSRAVANLSYLWTPEKPDWYAYHALFELLEDADSAIATTRNRLRFLSRMPLPRQTGLLRRTLSGHCYNPHDVAQLLPWMGRHLRRSLLSICYQDGKLWRHLNRYYDCSEGAFRIPKRWRVSLMREWMRNRVSWDRPSNARLPSKWGKIVNFLNCKAMWHTHSLHFDRAPRRNLLDHEGNTVSLTRLYEELQDYAREHSLLDAKGGWTRQGRLSAWQEKILESMAVVLAMAVINGEAIEVKARRDSVVWKKLKERFTLFLPRWQEPLSDGEMVRLIKAIE